MGAVGLFFVGAVLYVNAVMLLGRIDGRSGAVFNLFVGALQTFVPIYLIATAKGDTDQIFLDSGIFLFGFTYLYVGITNLAGHPSTGLGWYCSWVSVVAIAYSIANFVKFDDVKFGIIWLFWSFLWGLFFAVLGLGLAQLTRFTAWVTMIEAWVTAAIPAFLILAGLWDSVTTTEAVVVALASVLLIAALGTRTLRAAAPRQGVPTTPARPRPAM